MAISGFGNYQNIIKGVEGKLAAALIFRFSVTDIPFYLRTWGVLGRISHANIMNDIFCFEDATKHMDGAVVCNPFFIYIYNDALIGRQTCSSAVSAITMAIRGFWLLRTTGILLLQFCTSQIFFSSFLPLKYRKMFVGDLRQTTFGHKPPQCYSRSLPLVCAI